MANDGNVEHSVELLLQLGLKDDAVPNPDAAQDLTSAPPPPPAQLQRVASHNSQAALDAVARFEADESLARELWAADVDRQRSSRVVVSPAASGEEGQAAAASYELQSDQDQVR